MRANSGVDAADHFADARKVANSCKRPANWLLNLHGCERVLLCGQHLRRWEWMAHTTMDATCSTCGRVWPMQSDAYTASRI